MLNRNISLLLTTVLFLSCQKEKDIVATVYKEGKAVNDFHGTFYTTKYGGLNYYVSDEDQRGQLFNASNIDSIVFFINKKSYTAEPLVRKAFSRERNNSDFSFSINETERKIIIDTVDNMNTLTIFSEKTDMEELKDKKLINFTMIEN